MKKLLLIIQVFLVYLFFAFPVFAQVSLCDEATGITSVLCRIGGDDVSSIANTIRGIIIFLVVITTIIALFYLVYGGMKWITSRGDKAQVEESRNHIIAALIGIAVIFLSVFIMSIVLSAFGLDFNDLEIPTLGSSGPNPTPSDLEDF